MGRPIESLAASAASPTLLERERDLERITGMLAEAARGEGGSILIEGPPGVGKSALLRAGAAAAEEAGFDVLHATGREIERGFAFGVVVQLLGSVAEALEGAERDELFSGAAELARPLLERDDDALSSPDPFARLHGLHWLCANLSSRRPLLLSVDDAHWCDEPSLGFLAYLAARADEMPLCLAIVVRSDETEQGTQLSQSLQRERARRVEPAPLSEAAVAGLLRDRLGHEDARLAGECVRATGGNPLFLRELLRSIRAGDDLDSEQVAELAPEAVGRMVLTRIERMPDEDGRVVSTLAVLGDGADLPLVAQLSGVDPERLGESIDRLLTAGIVEAEPSLTFTHPIVRQAIYSSIAPAARSASHLQAARALAGDPELCERAAAHMLEVELRIEPPGADAIEALRLAANRARRRGAAEEAARLLERALEEELDPPLRRELLLELGVDELRIGGGRAVGHLLEANDLSPAGQPRAEATLALAVAQAQTGALAEAIETCDRALGELGSEREPRLALEAQRANASWIGGLMSDSGQRRLRALEEEVEAGGTPAERAVLTILAVEGATTGSRPASEVSDLAERALAGGSLLSDLGAEHPSYTSAVAALTLAGDFAAAIAEWSAGVEHSRAGGSRAGYANALFSRSYARFLIGDLRGAEADAVEGLELVPESALISQPFPLATMALVAAERGEAGADAGADAERAIELLMGGGEGPQLATVSYAALGGAQLALARGEPELALKRFLETGRRAELTGWTGPAALPWRSGAADALRALERSQESLKLVDEELDLAREYAAPGALGIALRTKSTIVGGAEGIKLAREAVAALVTSEAKLERAKALIELGAQLRRSTAKRDSRKPLREGMDLAHRCGSTLSVERALTELRASGARPRRPALRGIESLSPQERQTTRLAADGLTNRQIAEAMFLTRRTIEMHLSGAYRKLEIESREQLPEALRGE